MKIFSIVVAILTTMIAANSAANSLGLPADKIFHMRTGNPANPTIIFLHGNGDTRSSFDPILKQFSNRYQVVTYDQRGHGKTFYNGLDFSIEAMSEDLKNLISLLKLRDIHLVGHSFGARVAIKFAALHPNLVNSVTLIDMDLEQRQQSTAQECRKLGNYLRGFLGVYDSMDMLTKALSPISMYDSTFLAFATVRKLPAGAIELVSVPYVPYVWGCFANSLDLNPMLKQFPGPLLVLRADNRYSALSINGLKSIQSQRPDAKIVDFPGSTHAIHQHFPLKFAQTVIEFLETHSHAQ